MANKKLNLKGLILFCVGFIVFATAALGVGFFLLPKFVQKSDQITVVVEELPKVESSQQDAPKKQEPNTFFSAQEGSLFVQCEGIEKQEGSRVGIFLDDQAKCIVQRGQNQTEITAQKETEYVCFAQSFSSCRTIAEQKEAEQKEAEQKEAAQKEAEQKKQAQKEKQEAKNQPKEIPKVTSNTNRLKNEAEVIVTGPASISISADIDAVIFVDGKKIRKAPLFKYEVSAGPHKVTIVDIKDFSRRTEFSIDAESGMNYIRQWSFQDNTWLKKIP